MPICRGRDRNGVVELPIRMVPSVGFVKPGEDLSTVVLPQPDGPTSDTSSPWRNIHGHVGDGQKILPLCAINLSHFVEATWNGSSSAVMKAIGADWRRRRRHR